MAAQLNRTMSKPRRTRSAAYRLRRKLRRARRALAIEQEFSGRTMTPYLFATYLKAEAKVKTALRDPALRSIFP